MTSKIVLLPSAIPTTFMFNPQEIFQKIEVVPILQEAKIRVIGQHEHVHSKKKVGHANVTGRSSGSVAQW